MSLDEWKMHIESRTRMLEDTSASLLDSVKFQRRTNRARFENVEDILKRHGDEVRDLRQKFGPLRESVTRLCLGATRGPEWGKSKTIYGLYDLFMFVSSGLNATAVQRKKVTIRLYKRLVSGFRNWNYNPENKELADIDINNVIQLLMAFV